MTESTRNLKRPDCEKISDEMFSAAAAGESIKISSRIGSCDVPTGNSCELAIHLFFFYWSNIEAS
jgi:hypothetical protein